MQIFIDSSLFFVPDIILHLISNPSRFLTLFSFFLCFIYPKEKHNTQHSQKQSLTNNTGKRTLSRLE